MNRTHLGVGRLVDLVNTMYQNSAPTMSASNYQRIPNEIILHILEYALTLQSSRPIEIYRFWSFLPPSKTARPTGRLDRFVRVSRAFGALAIEAFYRNNSFLFKPEHGVITLTDRTLLLPPRNRDQFRRIEIRVDIAIYYEEHVPEQRPSFRPRDIHDHFSLLNEMARSDYCRPKHQPATVEEVLDKMAGWKLLKHLTNPTSGFNKLEHLRLKFSAKKYIQKDGEPDFCNEHFSKLIREAEIIIRAKTIEVDVSELAIDAYSRHLVALVGFEGEVNWELGAAGNR